MAQPGVDPIKYKGAWWSRDGHTILKWANEEWQPWAQETDEGEPPPRLVFESNQAAQGIEWADRAQEPNAGVSAVVSQARAAREAGTKIFQITLPVSATQKAFLWGDNAGIYGSSMATRNRDAHPKGVLDEIENEGWRLEHVGYVFQPRSTQSRDRFLASGQVETIVGEIIGIYLFRAVEEE